MTTLAEIMASDVNDVFLDTDEHAVSMLHLIGGDDGNISQVVGIITWHPTVPELDGGRATRRTGEIWLVDSVSVTVRDAFKIGANRVEVSAVGPKQHGGQVISIVQKLTETKGSAPVRNGGL